MIVALLRAFAEHSQGVHDTGVAFLGLVAAIPIVGQVIMTIWLGFFSGTLEQNQYGEPPRAWWKR